MDLDAAYDNRAAVADSARFVPAWAARSAPLRAAAGVRRDLRYGPAPRATLDLFPAPGRAVATVAFFHGGYWQWNRKEDFAFVADGLRALRVDLALVGYTLAPDATLDDIAAEARAAVAWLADRRTELGTAARLVAGGWSAGGHLAAIACEDPRVAAGFALSGIFDLEPLRRTSLNTVLRLDAGTARRTSPLVRPATPAPFDLSVGGDELPALQRQSRAFAGARRAAGAPGALHVYPGLNHYTILDALADPSSVVAADVGRLIAG